MSTVTKINKSYFSLQNMPTIANVDFDKEKIHFTLSDKRVVSIEKSWVTELKNASVAELKNFTTSGHFVFWDKYDAIVGVKNLLDGSIVPKAETTEH